MKKTLFVAYLVASCLTNASYGQDTNVNAAILESLRDAAHDPGIQFVATAYCKQTPEFHKTNPQWSLFDHVKTTYTGAILGSKFQVHVVLQQDDKKARPYIMAAFDGIRYSYLSREGIPTIFTSKLPNDTTLEVPLGTVILLPFEFLFTANNTIDNRFITPDMIQKVINDPAWAGVGNDYVLATPEATPNPDEVLRRFSHSNGNFYVVTFSKKKNFYPIKFEKFDSKSKGAQRYTVTDFTYLTKPDGKQIILPKEATLQTLIYGVLISTTTISLNEAQLMETLPDDSDFSIDPAVASRIYDSDYKKFINIPR